MSAFSIMLMPAFNNWSFWTVFSHRQEAVASRRIWMILLRWAAEFCELARGIWQNFPRKTVGTIYNDIHYINLCFTYLLTEWFRCLLSSVTVTSTGWTDAVQSLAGKTPISRQRPVVSMDLPVNIDSHAQVCVICTGMYRLRRCVS